MKLLLGSLLLAGICWLEATVVVPIMPNFDNQRIANTLWYPLFSIPTGEARSIPFYPFRFLAQPNGNLKYSIRIRQSGRCMTQEVPLTKQGQPGDYRSNIPSTLRFVETDYYTYFIAYISLGSTQEKTFLVLAGSQPNPMPVLEMKFREVATSLGITGEILRSALQATSCQAPMPQKEGRKAPHMNH